MSVETFFVHCLDGDMGATGIYWMTTRNATKYSTIRRTGPDNKELSAPKRQ